MATLHVGQHGIHASKVCIECGLVLAVWVISAISAAVLMLS